MNTTRALHAAGHEQAFAMYVESGQGVRRIKCTYSGFKNGGGCGAARDWQPAISQKVAKGTGGDNAPDVEQDHVISQPLDFRNVMAHVKHWYGKRTVKR